MKQHSILITFIGGILALCCFALTWVTFTQGGYKKSWETDVQTGKIGNATFRSSRPVTEQGSIIKGVPASHHKYSGFNIVIKGNLITIVLITAIATIVCSVYMLTQRTPNKSKLFVLISSGIGLGCLLLAFLAVMVISDNGIRSVGNTTYTSNGDIQFGGFGTALGFVTAFIGAWNIPKSNTPTESSTDRDRH